MIVVHGVIQPLFVAFITATVTIILLCICPLPVWLTNLLCYFGEHSTNIWLVHMFFYGSLFHGIVFFLKYPIPVFLFLIALSLASSYVIRWLRDPARMQQLSENCAKRDYTNSAEVEKI